MFFCGSVCFWRGAVVAPRFYFNFTTMKDKNNSLVYAVLLILTMYCVGSTVVLYHYKNKPSDPLESALISRKTSTNPEGGQRVELEVKRQKPSQAAPELKVNKRTESAVRVQTVFVHDTIIRVDTAYISESRDTVYIEGEFEDKWMKASVKASLDSIDIKVKVYNDFTMSVEDRPHLFKPDEAFIRIDNCNPYTLSYREQFYVVKKNKRKWWAWFLVGALAGTLTAFSL